MSKYKCIVPFCGIKASGVNRKPFFKFPTNEEKREEWISLTQITREELRVDSKVCYRHFSEDDYFTFSTKHTLKPGKIPKFNLPPVNKINFEQIFKKPVKQRKKKYKFININKCCNCEYKSHQQIERFMWNDKKILYYTGFQSFQIMLLVFRFIRKSEQGLVYPMATKTAINKLSPLNEFFFILIKLRRGLELQTLADQFSISITTAKKIFVTWINLIYNCIGSVNQFPHRTIILENAPQLFLKKYPNVIGSISCIEFHIPSSSVGQSECYSHYQGANTIKALIMIDPNGGIMFISRLFTGSIFDKKIMKDSGFLKILKDKVNIGELNCEDVILADPGFVIRNLLENIGIHIKIPTFSMTDFQFKPNGIEYIRKISHERIHVEKAIRKLISYKILLGKVPASMLGSLSQIFTVCCFLCNFRYLLRK